MKPFVCLLENSDSDFVSQVFCLLTWEPGNMDIQENRSYIMETKTKSKRGPREGGFCSQNCVMLTVNRAWKRKEEFLSFSQPVYFLKVFQ